MTNKNKLIIATLGLVLTTSAIAQTPPTSLPKTVVCTETEAPIEIFQEIVLEATSKPGIYQGTLSLIGRGIGRDLGAELVGAVLQYGFDGTKFFMASGESVLGDLVINLDAPIDENTYQAALPIIQADGSEKRFPATCHLIY